MMSNSSLSFRLTKYCPAAIVAYRTTSSVRELLRVIYASTSDGSHKSRSFSSCFPRG